MIASCNKKTEERFDWKKGDYYYRLISFSDLGKVPAKGKLLLVHASFVTQEDSLFWDSYNNLRNQFILEADSVAAGIITQQISKQQVGDSICLAIKVKDFMQEVYHTTTEPFFLKGDSVVKVYLGLARAEAANSKFWGKDDHKLAEFKEIEAFLGGLQKYEAARDEKGFFWLEKPEASPFNTIVLGQHIRVKLKGSFLSGRTFDQEEIIQEFDYGSPDQVLPGINYVIGRLTLSQTAKIILPSRLAFGEFGSSNGAVPPYTPLVYEVTVE